MTYYSMVHCDGRTRSGMRCRAFMRISRGDSAIADWEMTLNGQHFCPACSKFRAEKRESYGKRPVQA